MKEAKLKLEQIIGGKISKCYTEPLNEWKTINKTFKEWLKDECFEKYEILVDNPDIYNTDDCKIHSYEYEDPKDGRYVSANIVECDKKAIIITYSKD